MYRAIARSANSRLLRNTLARVGRSGGMASHRRRCASAPGVAGCAKVRALQTWGITAPTAGAEARYPVLLAAVSCDTLRLSFRIHRQHGAVKRSERSQASRS